MFSVLYTFFSFTAKGAPVHFEALPFRSESDAITHAERVFEEEPSAAEVFLYDGEREVSHAFRQPLIRLGRRATREFSWALCGSAGAEPQPILH